MNSPSPIQSGQLTVSFALAKTHSVTSPDRSPLLIGWWSNPKQPLSYGIGSFIGEARPPSLSCPASLQCDWQCSIVLHVLPLVSHSDVHPSRQGCHVRCEFCRSVRSAILTGITPGRLPSPHMWSSQIGGVVLRSPFIAIADYETEKRLPPHYLNVSM